MVCIRDDAQRKINGLSPVNSNIVATVLHDQDFWCCLDQLVRTIKPFVNAIGNVESHNANFAYA
jgi:hypothetical protein